MEILQHSTTNLYIFTTNIVLLYNSKLSYQTYRRNNFTKVTLLKNNNNNNDQTTNEGTKKHNNVKHFIITTGLLVHT